jgi:molybdopterin-guanine dinucleotide biosynthesis protein A
MKRAALILSGGRARRFQQSDSWQDKALAVLSGKPLLVYIVQTAQQAVDEVVICVNDHARQARYTQVLQTHGLGEVRFAVDEKTCEISGPNLAILSGLKTTHAEYCVTLPCDMPLMKPQVLDHMLKAVGDGEVAVPIWPNGRIETLVMAIKRDAGAEIAQTLCMLRRPRSDDFFRGAQKARFISPTGTIQTLDPTLESFVNINRQEDLAKLQTRPAHGSITKDLHANLGPLLVPQLLQLQNAGQLCNEDKLPEAATIFASVAETLEASKSFFWAAVSRENEAGTLLAYSAMQEEAQAAVDLDAKGKEAFMAAANDYCEEAEVHLRNRCRFLADRAWSDKAWCEGWVFGRVAVERYPSKP